MMNRRLNMPQLRKIMQDFEMQNEKMEMTGEMMGDAIDDAMGVRSGNCIYCVCSRLQFHLYEQIPSKQSLELSG